MQNYRAHSMPPAHCRPVPPVCNTSNSMPIAMAYVPWQTWHSIYDTEKGFHCGTIFQELNLPFLGKGGMKR